MSIAKVKVVGMAITPAERARKARALATRRKRYAAIREELNARRRAKYAADAEFRKHEQERKRESDARHATRCKAYAKRYRAENADRERARGAKRRKAPGYTERLRESEARRKEKMRKDAEYRAHALERKREWMRKYRAKKSERKKSSPAAANSEALVRKWEVVARGGPKKVAEYMRTAPETEKQRFLHWYGKKMNWIDSTGTRKFQPPPGAEVFVPSDDFFF